MAWCHIDQEITWFKEWLGATLTKRTSNSSGNGVVPVRERTIILNLWYTKYIMSFAHTWASVSWVISLCIFYKQSTYDASDFWYGADQNKTWYCYHIMTQIASFMWPTCYQGSMAKKVQLVRLWTTKRHTISVPHEWAVGCLLLVLWRKMSIRYWVHHVQ